MVRGKGQKDRPIFISEQSAEWIHRYLEKRQDNDPALFVRYSGNKQSSLDGNYQSSYYQEAYNEWLQEVQN